MLCINCQKETKNPKFCSRSCCVSYNNTIHPKRNKNLLICESCHKPFAKKRGNIKYCSLQCRYNHKIQIIESTGLFNPSWNNSKSIRKYLIQKYGNKCMLCGLDANNWFDKPITLIVDHIDGHSTNWSTNNIRIICPNCDSQLSTFKARNKGNSTRKYTITQK